MEKLNRLSREFSPEKIMFAGKEVKVTSKDENYKLPSKEFTLKNSPISR